MKGRATTTVVVVGIVVAKASTYWKCARVYQACVPSLSPRVSLSLSLYMTARADKYILVHIHRPHSCSVMPSSRTIWLSLVCGRSVELGFLCVKYIQVYYRSFSTLWIESFSFRVPLCLSLSILSHSFPPFFSRLRVSGCLSVRSRSS